MKHPVRATIIYIICVIISTVVFVPLTIKNDGKEEVTNRGQSRIDSIDFIYDSSNNVSLLGSLNILISDSASLYDYLSSKNMNTETAKGYIHELSLNFEHYLSVYESELPDRCAMLMDNILHYTNSVVLDINNDTEPTHSLSSTLKGILELEILLTGLLDA